MERRLKSKKESLAALNFDDRNKFQAQNYCICDSKIIDFDRAIVVRAGLSPPLVLWKVNGS